MKKECIAMLLAGGQGSRLQALTKNIAKPAVPFGGKYHMIDFALSNCVNSGIDTVGVLTQYQPLSLHTYLGSGQPWDLDRTDGGIHILPPFVGADNSGCWYQGTANAIYQNIAFMDRYHPDYVLVLSGDHIYKMDYTRMLLQHRQTQADCTIAALEVPPQDASRFGILSTAPDHQIISFEEKPEHPKGNLASMGIYLFNREVLRQHLIADQQDSSSKHDFGHDVIPRMLKSGVKLSAYHFNGYWRDVGTIPSFWDANMDILSPRSEIARIDSNWPVYTRSPNLPPHYIGSEGRVSHSIVTGGCHIDGTVENSVLFHSVRVEPGAKVKYSILMPGAVVRSHAVVSYSIVAEGAVVGTGAQVGSLPDGSDSWGITIVPEKATVKDARFLAANTPELEKEGVLV